MSVLSFAIGVHGAFHTTKPIAFCLGIKPTTQFIVPLWLSLPLTHWNSAVCVVEPPGVQIRHGVNLVDLPEWRNTDVCIPVGCSPPWTGRLRKHRAVWTGRCICLLDERTTPVMVETVWSFKNKSHRDIIPFNGKHLLLWTHQYCIWFLTTATYHFSWDKFWRRDQSSQTPAGYHLRRREPSGPQTTSRWRCCTPAR